VLFKQYDNKYTSYDETLTCHSGRFGRRRTTRVVPLVQHFADRSPRVTAVHVQKATTTIEMLLFAARQRIRVGLLQQFG